MHCDSKKVLVEVFVTSSFGSDDINLVPRVLSQRVIA